MSKNKKGFTLIELMMVVAIIGLLATLMLLVYIHAIKKSRDQKRRSDIESVATALELYKDKNGCYPPSISMNPFITNSIQMPDCLSSYLDPLPIDPLNQGIFVNNYEYSPGNYIRANNLETEAGNYSLKLIGRTCAACP